MKIREDAQTVPIDIKVQSAGVSQEEQIFYDYRWVGPFIAQKVLPNENYILRRLNTNKPQILHRIRLKKFVSNELLEDSYRDERLKPDEKIIIPQDDLYITTWETNFGEQLVTRGNEPIPTSLPNGERPVTSNADSNGADENEVAYIIANDSTNDVNDAAQERNERMNDDVSRRNEAIEAEKNENSHWPFAPKIKKNLCRIRPKDRKTMQFFGRKFF